MKLMISILLAGLNTIALAQKEYMPNQPCYDFENNKESMVYDIYPVSSKNDTCSWANDWRNTKTSGISQHFEGALPLFIDTDFIKVQNPNGGFKYYHFTSGKPSNRKLNYTFSMDKKVYEVKVNIENGMAIGKITLFYADAISLTRSDRFRKYAEGTVRNGEVVGDWVFYNTESTISHAVSYQRGIGHPRKIKQYSKEGKLELVTIYDGDKEIARQDY